MQLVWTLIVGFIVGVIAKFLMPGRDPGGFFITIILGIAGALFAGWIGQKLHFYHQGQPAGFIASVVGAMILLFVYRLFSSNNQQS